ncbi:MAG TPA: peptide chain release factor 3, partial [Fibrobacteres bacterium]|nr:peptide chain release factor 3 [Fibrobacterota bacterium]
MTLEEEILRRRTFAIVSHPDAGKTTITEKFLWYGGVIREAGHVRAKAGKKFTTSDWMKIEQQRGISVSSSVLSFPYSNCQINLVDTPGHQDFCEDTYRALTTVDSALVLIDSAKGVEPQTIKLMEVWRLRKTPITVFMNKMDRDALDPLALMDEVERILGVRCAPRTMPIGNGKMFQGVYSFIDNSVHLFQPDAEESEIRKVQSIHDPKLDEWFDAKYLAEFRDHAELALGATEPFDREKYLNGEQAPVYFGSAINNFGVKHLLDSFVAVAPAPLPRHAKEREVSAVEPCFTGFVFKIQANTDPKHRDRIAFIRVCSGKFSRGSKVTHCRTGRQVRLAAPTALLANDRTVLDESYAGDIIGIHDPGLYNISDTLSESENLSFEGIPDFAPEHFCKVYLEDPLKSKQLQQGLNQLSEEGATQLFLPLSGPIPVLGVVGVLQFDVLKFRLEGEY